MAKIVYNACFGGFGLSKKAIDRYWQLKGEPMPEGWWDKNVGRADPVLVQVVEELGGEADGAFADLQIRELPAGALYRIDEYDGSEAVVVQDEYEWSVA